MLMQLIAVNRAIERISNVTRTLTHSHSRHTMYKWYTSIETKPGAMTIELWWHKCSCFLERAQFPFFVAPVRALFHTLTYTQSEGWSNIDSYHFFYYYFMEHQLQNYTFRARKRRNSSWISNQLSQCVCICNVRRNRVACGFNMALKMSPRFGRKVLG